LNDLLTRFHDVFALDTIELGRTDTVQHIIDTGTHQPIWQQPHRIPFVLQKQAEELIETMLKEGIVTQSKSPWASPVVLVAKRMEVQGFV